MIPKDKHIHILQTAYDGLLNEYGSMQLALETATGGNTTGVTAFIAGLAANGAMPTTTEWIKKAILAAHAASFSYKDIAETFDVSNSYVGQVVRAAAKEADELAAAKASIDARAAELKAERLAEQQAVHEPLPPNVNQYPDPTEPQPAAQVIEDAEIVSERPALPEVDLPLPDMLMSLGATAEAWASMPYEAKRAAYVSLGLPIPLPTEPTQPEPEPEPPADPYPYPPQLASLGLTAEMWAAMPDEAKAKMLALAPQIPPVSAPNQTVVAEQNPSIAAPSPTPQFGVPSGEEPPLPATPSLGAPQPVHVPGAPEPMPQEPGVHYAPGAENSTMADIMARMRAMQPGS